MVCMAVTPGGSLFWRWYTRKHAKQFAEDLSTKHMDYWNHVLWSDEIKINFFCSNGFKHVFRDHVRSPKLSVSCLQSSIVVRMSWPEAAWVLQVLEIYISLRETWTVKHSSRAWFPASRNWVAGQCSSMTMTPNTPPRQKLLYWRG